MSGQEPQKPIETAPVAIEDEMRKSYLDYAMSVIVSRAIPDVRDGLKPVHRRILYAMLESGCDFDKPYRKSARIVGEVMGKYHPHGDLAIYDALVRMAQDFSMRLPLIDGQGNFGSLDGDPPAAMRYTESRLAKAAHKILQDIEFDTVAFQENYDGSEKEPIVLPSRFPNILVNGAGGIAVGMATNIPTHNLGEVIDACCAYIDNPDVTTDELLALVPAPDFPTGGLILGRGGARQALSTGRGSVMMRGRAEIEEIKGNRSQIVITEIPYQVNKLKLVERIGELVRDKKIEGISDLRDESNKEGIRVVVEVKRDAMPDVVLNQLYSFTPLQTSFGVNMLALDGGRPDMMTLRKVVESFVAFRREVITKRTAYLLGKSRDRAHVLIGLAIAVANIDEVIKVIRNSPDPNVAREELMRRDWDAGDVLPLLELVDDVGNKISGGRIKFTETQARAILELRLQRLTGLERKKIDEEMNEVAAEIRDYLETLSSPEKLMGILRSELVEVKNEFATPRRTEIVDSEFEQDIEDLIQREDMVVTVTMGGYIKRVPLATFRAQRRGGKGKSAISIREEDATSEFFAANTHTPVLFFSNYGKVYKLKVYQLPLGNPQARGKALVNLLPLGSGERIQNFMPLPEDESLWEQMHIFFSTASGNVRRNDLSDFRNVQSNGKIAIKLEDGDKLTGVSTCMDTDHVLLATKFGKSVRFPVNAVRLFKSRTSDGVRGIKLGKGDEVVSMTILSGVEADLEIRQKYLRMASALKRNNDSVDENQPPMDMGEAVTALDPETYKKLADQEQFILTITERGYGKRTSAYEYRVTNRGGSGIINMEITKKNGPVIASFPVLSNEEVIILTSKGKLFRTSVEDIRLSGRNTQGVIVIRPDESETVVSAIRVPEEDEVEETGGEA